MEDDERMRLNVVLTTAGDDEKMVRAGIIKALRDVDEPARRKYLWNFLNRKAREIIRKARARVRLPGKISPA